MTICGEDGRHNTDRTGQEMEIMSVNTASINDVPQSQIYSCKVNLTGGTLAAAAFAS